MKNSTQLLELLENHTSSSSSSSGWNNATDRELFFKLFIEYLDDCINSDDIEITFDGDSFKFIRF